MSADRKTPEWALDAVRFESDAGDNMSCREYLCALLDMVWVEEEGFSGKRPWGNSGWQGDMLIALAKAECIASVKDGWGDVEPDEKAGNKFVRGMIAAMARGAA